VYSLASSFSDQKPMEELLKPEATKEPREPAAFIEHQVAGPQVVPFLGCLERHAEAHHPSRIVVSRSALIVDSGCVGTGAVGLEIQGATGLSPFARGEG
jgi:hypothetical protein